MSTGSALKTLRRTLCAFPVLLLVACQMIAGIGDDDYRNPPPASPLCEQYCDTVMANCKYPHQVYANADVCLAVCSRLPPGDPRGESDGKNTVACRLLLAGQAKDVEQATFCPGAGPGGGNPNGGPGGQCGSNCASYCSLLNQICPATSEELKNCEAQCAALVDTGTYDIKDNYNGDTLQCRLVHLSTASYKDTVLHCDHAKFRPSETCGAGPDDPVDCAAYCHVVNAVCTGANAVYESDEQCKAVCAKLPPGTRTDQQENTMWCRKYHAYNAIVLASDASDAAATHCVHAGPGGNGHCGVDAPDKTGNCESFCHLALSGCPAEFVAKYGAEAGAEAACQKECSNKPAEFGAVANTPVTYRVKSVDMTPTLECRMLHVARALAATVPATVAAECANVFGGPSCPD